MRIMRVEIAKDARYVLISPVCRVVEVLAALSCR